jgi:hypothetical protein
MYITAETRREREATGVVGVGCPVIGNVRGMPAAGPDAAPAGRQGHAMRPA